MLHTHTHTHTHTLTHIHTRDRWEQFGGVASLVLEDIPQVAVSVAFLVKQAGLQAGLAPGSRQRAPAIVVLSLAASVVAIFLAVVMRLVLWCVVSDAPNKAGTEGGGGGGDDDDDNIAVGVGEEPDGLALADF